MTKEHNYVLFAFDKHSPEGGWGDMLSTHSSLEEAKEALAHSRKTNPYECYQIIAVRENIIIKETSKN